MACPSHTPDRDSDRDPDRDPDPHQETSGLQSSNVAHKAARTFPAYRTLVLFLKRWLNVRGLHDTFSGGIG